MGINTGRTVVCLFLGGATKADEDVTVVIWVVLAAMMVVSVFVIVATVVSIVEVATIVGIESVASVTVV